MNKVTRIMLVFKKKEGLEREKNTPSEIIRRGCGIVV